MSEVRTTDCVAAIKKTRPGDLAFSKIDWKRTHKYRAEDPRDDFDAKLPDFDKECWLREFVSSTDDKQNPETIAFVWSIEDRIVEVRILQRGGNAKDCFEIHPYNGCTNFKNDNQPVTAILVKNEDGDFESQDFENYELRSCNGNEAVIWHGGDWQEPKTTTYRLMSDGKFYFKPGTTF